MKRAQPDGSTKSPETDQTRQVFHALREREASRRSMFWSDFMCTCFATNLYFRKPSAVDSLHCQGARGEFIYAVYPFRRLVNYARGLLSVRRRAIYVWDALLGELWREKCSTTVGWLKFIFRGLCWNMARCRDDDCETLGRNWIYCLVYSKPLSQKSVGVIELNEP